MEISRNFRRLIFHAYKLLATCSGTLLASNNEPLVAITIYQLAQGKPLAIFHFETVAWQRAFNCGAAYAAYVQCAFHVKPPPHCAVLLCAPVRRQIDIQL